MCLGVNLRALYASNGVSEGPTAGTARLQQDVDEALGVRGLDDAELLSPHLDSAVVTKIPGTRMPRTRRGAESSAKALGAMVGIRSSYAFGYRQDLLGSWGQFSTYPVPEIWYPYSLYTYSMAGSYV